MSMREKRKSFSFFDFVGLPLYYIYYESDENSIALQKKGRGLAVRQLPKDR